MFKIGSKITAFYKNVIEQISSRDSNYVIDMVIWAKFVNSRIPNREVEILLWGFDQKNSFWEEGGGLGLFLVSVWRNYGEKLLEIALDNLIFEKM